MCEFTNPDQKVMGMMLAKCPNQKWQEQRAIKKWDHTKLADVEEYARILEQTQLFTKKLKKTYPSTSKVNAVRVEKCRNCGLEHDKGRCPAYNKECFKCSQLHHFASLCRQTRRNPRGRGGFSNRRSGQRGSRRSYHNRGGRTTTEDTIQGIITTEGTPTTTIEETPTTTIEETTVTTIEVVIQEAETMDSKETLVVATRVSKAQSEPSMKEGMKMASTMGYKTNKITHQTHLKRV